MSNVIIIAILAVVILVGIRESVRHFKGQGGCCGGGSEVKPKRKKLSGPIMCKHTIKIEGMHCENCRNRIESKINELDGVACKVSLRKKEAVVKATYEVDIMEILGLINNLGYTSSVRDVSSAT